MHYLYVLYLHYYILCDLSAVSQYVHHLFCAYTATVNARSNIVWCKEVKFICYFTLWTQMRPQLQSVLKT